MHTGKLRIKVAGVARTRYAGQVVAILHRGWIVAHATVTQNGTFATTLWLAGRHARVRAAVTLDPPAPTDRVAVYRLMTRRPRSFSLPLMLTG